MVDLNIELPDGFLDEEVRFGYKISRKMKEVWAVELDILNQFQHVCEKYGLTYSVSGGTMLGAVRHKGFIPWDDDIDIDMPRKDYKILCSVAKREFQEPYFFQTEHTDRGSMYGHAQIRRSDTTAILKSNKGLKTFNQGIFIDIFPLDSIPDTDEKAIPFTKQIYVLKRLAGQINSLSNIKEVKQKKRKILAGFLFPICCILYTLRIDSFLYLMMEHEAQKYNEKHTGRVAAITFLPKEKKIRFDSCYLTETIEVPFEFTTVKISRIYDEILKQMYGDYMNPVQGGSIHGGVFFDTDVSYKEYLKKEN